MPKKTSGNPTTKSLASSMETIEQRTEELLGAVEAMQRSSSEEFAKVWTTLGGIAGLDGLAVGLAEIAEVMGPLRQLVPPSTALDLEPGVGGGGGAHPRRARRRPRLQLPAAGDGLRRHRSRSSGRPARSSAAPTTRSRSHDPAARPAARRGTRRRGTGHHRRPARPGLADGAGAGTRPTSGHRTRRPPGPHGSRCSPTARSAPSPMPVPARLGPPHLRVRDREHPRRRRSWPGSCGRSAAERDSASRPSPPSGGWTRRRHCCSTHGNPVAAWLSTSAVRPDAEAVRRNAYFRMFGMDLAHGTDAQRRPIPTTRRRRRTGRSSQLFEELLFELWRAIENIRNLVAGNTTDDDRIYRLAEQLGFMLRSAAPERPARAVRSWRRRPRWAGSS